jgi:hypothetical protein
MLARGRRTDWLGAAVAVLALAAFASVGRAATYHLSGPIVQRAAPTPGNFDFGYRGPRFLVTRGGHSSSDTYVCPSGQSLSNWVVVGDTADSADRDFDASSSGSGNQFNIFVINWSPYATVYLRLAASCTTAPNEFPYDPNNCGDFSCPYPPGQYLPYWYGVFSGGQPGTAQYAQLIQRAFCWSTTYPGCGSAGARNGPGRFPLHNGTNTLFLTFRQPSATLPPAFRLAGASGCTARRLRVAVQNRTGYLRVVLRCGRVRRGAAARLRFVKPVRRSFGLRRGNGSVRVQVAKPLGTARPLLYVAYGHTNKRCANVRAQVRVRSRTSDLAVSARCGRAAGNAVANLYIGGLLQ